MFVKLGDLINRIGPGLLLGWIGILIFVMTLAPPLWDVVETEEFSALPATSPSLLGEQLFRAAFPKSLVPSRIVIVVRRPDEKLTEQDLDWVDDGIHDDDPERDFELRECLLKIAEDDGGLDSESNEELPAGSHRNRRSLISSVRTYRDKTLEPQQRRARDIGFGRTDDRLFRFSKSKDCRPNPKTAARYLCRK